VKRQRVDIYMMGFFAAFGYICIKLECEPAPLILGFVLDR